MIFVIICHFFVCKLEQIKYKMSVKCTICCCSQIPICAFSEVFFNLKIESKK